MLFENKNYKIEVEDGKYAVINKSTRVVEETTTVFPQALVFAEQFNTMLETNAHSQFSYKEPDRKGVVALHSPKH